jgi:hypothetical protein
MIFSVAETEETVSFTPRTVIVAGFTGRNRAAVDVHIRELMDQGVQPPESVPAFYVVPPSLLSNAAHIKVSTAESSGEAEPVLLCLSDSWYVAVGSDHTARDMERVDIGESKRACPKLVSTEVWPYEDVRRHWDGIIVRSWVRVNGEKHLYQEASLAELMTVSQILDALEQTTIEDADGAAIFLGTVPLLTNGFVFSDWYSVELHNTSEGRHLGFAYSVEVKKGDE